MNQKSEKTVILHSDIARLPENPERDSVPASAIGERYTVEVAGRELDILYIYNFPDGFPLNEWQDSMLWCPSQCFYHVVDNKKIHWVLYLRWRWEDPWEATIYRNCVHERDMNLENRTVISTFPDFTDDQVEEAKAELIRIYEEGFKNKG